MKRSKRVGRRNSMVNRNFEIPQIDSEVLKEISRVSAWRGLAQVSFEWACIASLITVGWVYFNPLLYIVAVILIGSRQHALGVLMHDASHHRIARNRIVNDIVTELFIAWPCFFSMQSFRRNHLRHHRYLNTLGDPDFSRKVEDPANWAFPRSMKSLVAMLIRDILGLNTLLTFKDIRLAANATPSDQSGYLKLAKAGYYLALFGTIHYLNAWAIYFLFWIVPGFTMLRLCLHLRAIADHLGMDHDDENLYSQIRSIKINWIEKALLAPNNIEHHIEHHFYPSVPFYNLPRLSAELNKNEWYRHNAHVTDGFIGLIKECSLETTKSRVIDRLNRVEARRPVGREQSRGDNRQ